MIALSLALAAAGLPGQVAGAQPPSVPQTQPPSPVVVSRPARTKGDPHEQFNRRMFRLQDRVDRRFLAPAAKGYVKVLPRFLRSAIRNFFGNLGEPIVFLNYVLQHKIGKAAETVGRFAVNSTVGIAGTIDVAKTKAVKLPHRPNGLGNTLGFYGVKPGPYLFLPFVGPTTLRDLVGGQVDGLVLPLAVGKPFDRLYYQIPRGVLTGLDRRAESDAELKALFDGAVDPYATLRSVYLQDRAGEIAALHVHRGSAPTPGADQPGGDMSDPLTDPAAAPATSGTAELSDPMADPEQPAVPASPPSAAPELQDPLADPAAADPAAPARR